MVLLASETQRGDTSSVYDASVEHLWVEGPANMQSANWARLHRFTVISRNALAGLRELGLG